MKKIIEKFYAFIFADKEDEEPVPYSNKVFMFYFSIIITSVVLFLIVEDILRNIEKMKTPTG